MAIDGLVINRQLYTVEIVPTFQNKPYSFIVSLTFYIVVLLFYNRYKAYKYNSKGSLLIASLLVKVVNYKINQLYRFITIVYSQLGFINRYQYRYNSCPIQKFRLYILLPLTSIQLTIYLIITSIIYSLFSAQTNISLNSQWPIRKVITLVIS